MKTTHPDRRLLERRAEITNLRQIIAHPMVNAAAKRAAALKIQQLQRIEANPRTTRPGAASDTDARVLAFNRYKFLCAQRTALTRRWGRLSRAEFDLHQALTEHLPAEAPPVLRPHDTPEPIHDKCWDDFVASIKTALAAVRDLPTPGN